ncbi:regulator of chromosome condensation 1/beta-lactamase-inhibitor protein II [Jimgerdemannia flammicorona]|uniref:Regulator of chromosome condensation 1/beta-lactamase-inhibitor protein II n=1 Tax=Jimgerdemannia flammicorona TaxID=994334 RepID=A0A433DIK8_9FUNG|nr:regulator of chromosome condensation 1/beta-lactamase-inhibitor protein II [Jimgerdemannia flammicorona]
MAYINALPVRKTTSGTVYVHHGSTAKALAIDADIVDICAGPEHCVAIDTSGRVWTWGCADHGALGHGDSDGPAVVTALGSVDVAAVSCGWQFTIALSTKGDLYAWGAFLDKECYAVPMGQPACINRRTCTYTYDQGVCVDLGIWQAIPAWVELFRAPPTAGYFHSFATDTNGVVFAWGLNNAIQTGIEQRKPDFVKIPTKVGNLHDLAITAAKTHTFVRREHGMVIAFGTETTAPLPPIKAIAAGNAFSVALADDNCVY